MTVRAVLHEEPDARDVAARLRAAGFAASVARELLAGEDDDEGHPWVVLTDAPEAMAEMYVEECDGWVDVDDPRPSAPHGAATAASGRTTPSQGSLPGHIAFTAWTNGCCSSTPTLTTRRSAREPRWRSTSRAAPR